MVGDSSDRQYQAVKRSYSSHSYIYSDCYSSVVTVSRTHDRCQLFRNETWIAAGPRHYESVG
jgi:hypothetical protein